MMRLITVLILAPILLAGANATHPPLPQQLQNPATSVSWQHPLVNGLAPMAPFDPPAKEWGAGHRGVDFSADQGDTVYAPTAGVITFAGMVAGRPVVSMEVGADLVVSVEPVSSDLQPGQIMTAGERLGEVAQGGHCRSDCLHMGVRLADVYVNPMRFLWGKPALLPSA